MKKELRIKVWNKYNGHCAYCGKEIEYKDMQVDHVHPKSLRHFYQSKKMKEYYKIKSNNINDIENLNPSCRRCNYHKSNLSLEDFRKMILRKSEVLNGNWHYKIAKDYGLIKEIETPLIFYFEKL